MDQQSFAPIVIRPDPHHGRRAETGRMGDLVAVPDVDPALQPLPLPLPSAPEASSTYLVPTEDFPSSLAELELTELQVLHSRATRELDREYCTDPDGPHPVTLDRVEELVAELDTRQEFLAPPVTAGTPARPGSRVGAAVLAEAPDGARTGRVHPPAARRNDEQLEALFRRRHRPVGPAEVRVLDLDRLQPGDELEIWQHDRLQCTGAVEEVATPLGVLWIREAVDGYRRMVHVHDTVLRYRLRHEPR